MFVCTQTGVSGAFEKAHQTYKLFVLTATTSNRAFTGIETNRIAEPHLSKKKLALTRRVERCDLHL